jgi:hypothetical protein
MTTAPGRGAQVILDGEAQTIARGGNAARLMDNIRTINGVAYAVSAWNSGDSITLTTSAGVQSGVAYLARVNIFDQISAFRVQKTIGANEENLTIAARANGEYIIAAFNSGQGTFFPIRMATGSYAGSPQYMLTLHPGSTGTAGDGFVSVGGYDNAESLRVPRLTGAVNRVEAWGGTTGFGASIRARGSDTNVGLGLDTQGAGGFAFTIGSFGTQAAAINGSAGATGYVELVAGSATAFINAKGSAPDIDLALAGKGAGGVRIGPFASAADAPVTGYMTVKDSNGIPRKVAVIA